MQFILNVGHGPLFGKRVAPSAVSSPAVIKYSVSSHSGLCHSTGDLLPAREHNRRPEHVGVYGGQSGNGTGILVP